MPNDTSSSTERLEPGIPPELEMYRPLIESTKRTYVRVELRRANGTGPTASKFRGTPYLRKGDEYPRDKNGDPLALLAQINFADVPPLEDFPDEGILQIFVRSGMNREHVWGKMLYRGEPWDPAEYFRSLRRQDYFKVIYHPGIVHDETELRSRFPVTGNELPITEEFALSFESDEEYLHSEDYMFEEMFGVTSTEFYERHAELGPEAFARLQAFLVSDAPAKVGGYGRFVQGDPREIAPEDEDWLVLLNIESTPVVDGGDGIVWGDGGVATFLIERRDLIRRDFSRVAYYWDNH